MKIKKKKQIKALKGHGKQLVNLVVKRIFNEDKEEKQIKALEGHGKQLVNLVVEKNL